MRTLTESERQLIRDSCLFDGAWYAEKFRDVAATGLDPLEHFLRTGIYMGREPGPLFDSKHYCRQLEQATHDRNSESPLVDYLSRGWKVGLNPHPFFDVSFYLENNPDVAVLGIEPLGHYLRYGYKEGRAPNLASSFIEAKPTIQALSGSLPEIDPGESSQKPKSYKSKKICNDEIRQHSCLTHELQNLTSSIAFRDFGYSYLSPLLSHYFSQVISNMNDKIIPVCLAREGYLFQNAILHLRRRLLIKSCAEPLYLKVSRTLLFKSIVGSDCDCPELYQSNFFGTFASFLSGRCGINASFVKCQLTSQDANKCISLPIDTEIAQVLINKYKKQIINETSKTKMALLHYFKSLGLFDNPETPMFLDLGYSGTIQKLLTRLLGRDTHGIYVISSCPGSFPVGKNYAFMKGTLKENVKMGDGYIPLDRSLFLECLLTSPHGQMLDILEIEKGKFDFIYGPPCSAQRFSHSLKELHEGAIEGMIDHLSLGIQWSVYEIEQLASVQTSNIWCIPRLIQHLFTIDDSISGNSLINPFRIHKMVA